MYNEFGEYDENMSDDIGADDGSLAREMFQDEDYRDRFESGQMMDENDY